MSGSFLDKLKKSVIAGAQTSAIKIEEAARTAKLHLDIMAEKRRLSQNYTELGKEAHLALLENSIAQFSARPGIDILQNQIEKCKRTILDLEFKVMESQKKNK